MWKTRVEMVAKLPEDVYLNVYISFVENRGGSGAPVHHLVIAEHPVEAVGLTTIMLPESEVC